MAAGLAPSMEVFFNRTSAARSTASWRSSKVFPGKLTNWTAAGEIMAAAQDKSLA